METSKRYIDDLMTFMDKSVINFFAVKTMRFPSATSRRKTAGTSKALT